MPKGKPYTGVIDTALVLKLLNNDKSDVDSNLGTELLETSARLADLVRRANESLQTNEFTKIIAKHLSASLRKRGQPEIHVTPTGAMILQVTYHDDEEAEATPMLPLLKDLKLRADRLGVSIDHLGIKRREIRDYLDQVEGIVRPPAPKKQRTTLVQKYEAETLVPSSKKEEEDEDSPMSMGPDEITVSPIPEVPKGFFKRSPALANTLTVVSDPEKRVRKSTDIDLHDLLTSDPPKQ